MLRFNIKDCEVSVSTGFFALITLMLITCDVSLVVLSLICSLFHELGHIVAMLFFGERLRCISFSVVGIKIDKLSVTALSYTQETIVSLAGIFANCLLSLVGFIFYYTFNLKYAHDIAVVSIAVACFNLLPIDSLDGSRALYFFLMSRIPERQTDTIIFTVSLLCTALLLGFSFIMLRIQGTNFSLIAVTVYLGFMLICRLVRMKGGR